MFGLLCLIFFGKPARCFSVFILSHPSPPPPVWPFCCEPWQSLSWRVPCLLVGVIMTDWLTLRREWEWMRKEVQGYGTVVEHNGLCEVQCFKSFPAPAPPWVIDSSTMCTRQVLPNIWGLMEPSLELLSYIECSESVQHSSESEVFAVELVTK